MTTNAPPVITKAQRHLKENGFDAAVLVLTKHLQQVPLDVEALNMLGYAYFRMGRFTDAKSTYMQMWSAAPTDYRAMFGTGIALQKLGEFDDAERWFWATLAVNPDFERAATRLRDLPAARASTQTWASDVAAGAGGPTKPRMNTLTLPDNADELATYRRTSRDRARVDMMNQHWYGIPWPIRVIQVSGLLVILFFFIRELVTRI